MILFRYCHLVLLPVLLIIVFAHFSFYWPGHHLDLHSFPTRRSSDLSRRRTILLGALAGRRFFLTAVTEVREGDHAAEIHYRWGPAAGLALGGTIGRSRAERVHTQLAAELEAQLERSGHLLQVRRR